MLKQVTSVFTFNLVLPIGHQHIISSLNTKYMKDDTLPCYGKDEKFSRIAHHMMGSPNVNVKKQ